MNVQEKTCKYIALSLIGFVCMKDSPAQKKLDELAKSDKIKAKGDNCRGINFNEK